MTAGRVLFIDVCGSRWKPNYTLNAGKCLLTPVFERLNKARALYLAQQPVTISLIRWLFSLSSVGVTEVIALYSPHFPQTS